MRWNMNDELYKAKKRVESTDAYNRILQRARKKLKEGVIGLDLYEDVITRLYYRKMVVLQLTDYRLHKLAIERGEQND